MCFRLPAPSIYRKSKIFTIYKKTTPLHRLFLQISQFYIKDFPLTSISEDFFPLCLV